jgi:hypothetical protein
MNVQLTIVKAELREILDVLQVIKPEHELEILRRLQKLIPTAQALVDETRDKELGEVLTAVAAKLTCQARPGLRESSSHAERRFVVRLLGPERQPS